MLRRHSLILALGLMAGAAAGAAQAQEREWSLDVSEEEAYLIFGVPDTDDVGVSLWCPVGKGVVRLYLPVPTAEISKAEDNAAPLTITAGDGDGDIPRQGGHQPGGCGLQRRGRNRRWTTR